MKKNTLISWSTGKDSAWSLYLLLNNPDISVNGIFCTVTEEFSRTAMHGVRVELLRKQAESIGLPLKIIEIPYPCINKKYESVMEDFVNECRDQGIQYFAFGDLFLGDIRSYRENNLKETGIKPIFPLWNIPTEKLAREMIDYGLKAVTTCINPKNLNLEFIGRKFDHTFLDQLPDGVDHCGENGEFHTFVYDGPMFANKIDFSLGDIVKKDGFVFIDLK